MNALRSLPALIATLALAGCATLPPGPTRPSYPATGRTLDRFRVDDLQCRDYALAQAGGAMPVDRATEAGVASAVAGSAIGAVIGGLINGSSGAAVGAGTWVSGAARALSVPAAPGLHSAAEVEFLAAGEAERERLT